MVRTVSGWMCVWCGKETEADPLPPVENFREGAIWYHGKDGMPHEKVNGKWYRLPAGNAGKPGTLGRR
jgi:hypothetical protein